MVQLYDTHIIDFDSQNNFILGILCELFVSNRLIMEFTTLMVFVYLSHEAVFEIKTNIGCVTQALSTYKLSAGVI